MALISIDLKRMVSYRMVPFCIVSYRGSFR